MGSREWTNVDTQQSNDIYRDHILMHSGGSSNRSTSLGYRRPCDIAYRKVHTAKVQYLPHIEMGYFELMMANENLILYFKDNNEGRGRSIGTLAVFIDQGIVEELPLILHPLQLPPLPLTKLLDTKNCKDVPPIDWCPTDPNTCKAPRQHIGGEDAISIPTEK